MQEVQSPRQKAPTEAHAQHSIINVAKVKDRERILKPARERQLPTVELP